MFLRNLLRGEVKKLSSADERIIDILEKNIDNMGDLPVKYIMNKADVSPSSFYNFLKKMNVSSIAELSKKISIFVNPTVNKLSTTQSSMYKSIKWFLNWNYENLINSSFIDFIDDMLRVNRVILVIGSDFQNVGNIFYEDMIKMHIEVDKVESSVDLSRLLLIRNKIKDVPILFLNGDMELEMNNTWDEEFKNNKYALTRKQCEKHNFKFVHEIKVPSTLAEELAPRWEFGFLLALDLIKHGVYSYRYVNERKEK